jgi:eukaryotic-like serine/threonine-protein kinase
VVALAADDPTRARAEIDRALAQWSRDGFHMQHLGALQSNVLVDLYEGDSASAARRVAAARSSLRGSPILRGRLARIAALVTQASASLAAAAASPEPSPHIASALRDAKLLEAEGSGGEPMAWPIASAGLIRASAAALRGDTAAARSLLEAAITSFEQASMALDASAARRRLGALVGGSEGRGLIEAADAFMVGQGVVRPDRLAAALAPGFKRA